MSPVFPRPISRVMSASSTPSPPRCSAAGPGRSRPQNPAARRKAGKMIRLRRNTTTVVPARVPATKDSHPPTPSAWVPPSPAVRERGFTPRQRTRLALAALILATITGTAPAHAVRPDEMLADPALEARAREISRELRCLVCRNQSIDDSDADLAHDLRVLVRERLKSGDSNDQTIGFVRARYGDFVLLRPPFAIDRKSTRLNSS